MHELSWAIFSWGIGIGFAVEMTAYFLMPRVLTWAAVLPVGAPLTFALPPVAREALTTELAHAGGYRVAPARSFSLARAGLPERLERPGAIARIYPALGLATVRLPYVINDKILSIARIDIVERDGTIELQARFLPLMTVTLVVAGTLGVGSAVVADGLSYGTFELLILGGVFVAANLLASYFFGRRKIAAAVAIVAAEISGRLRNAGSEVVL
jgi:hypothetical protein